MPEDRAVKEFRAHWHITASITDISTWNSFTNFTLQPHYPRSCISRMAVPQSPSGWDSNKKNLACAWHQIPVVQPVVSNRNWNFIVPKTTGTFIIADIQFLIFERSTGETRSPGHSTNCVPSFVPLLFALVTAVLTLVFFWVIFRMIESPPGSSNPSLSSPYLPPRSYEPWLSSLEQDPYGR